MSLWTSIRNTITGAAKGFISSGGSILGALGGAVTQGKSTMSTAPYPSAGGYAAYQQTVAPYMSQSMAALPQILPTAATLLPKLPSVMPGVGVAAGRAARTVATAVGGEMIWDAISGSWKPKRKRRRAKGITAAQLRGFKRVAKILHDYQKVATKHHVKAPARRR